MSKPKVVITAAGSNSRFFPLNTMMHKGALTLMGETFIARTLKNLADHGFSDIVIVVSQRDEESGSLQKAVSANQGNLNIEFVVQKEANGMGDAVLTAKHLLSERFFVIFPDLINAGELADKMLAMGDDSVICTTKTTEPWLYGIVELENGLAKSITEKPTKGSEKSDQRVTGCYLLSQKFLSTLASLPVEEYSFESALDQLFKQEAVKVVQLEQSVVTLKYPWHLFKFQDVIFSQLTSKTDPSAQIASTAVIDDSQGPVVIEAGAKVGDFVKIVGPTYIGQDSLVGDYSFIRGSSLEKGVTVGANTEVVRSIILDNTNLHFSYLADSILGPNTQVGAGLITANKRLDRKSVQTMVKGIMTDTGVRALGIVTGEGAKLGIGLNTMPGVLIGAEAIIHPGVTVKKNVDHSETLQK